jgi:hypothetical protein
MRIEAVIWMPDVVDKLARKHGVSVEEVEQVSSMARSSVQKLKEGKARPRAKGKNQIDPLPETFTSYQELATFWDTHSTADYEEYFKEVTCDVDLKRRVFTVPIDGEVFRRIQRAAAARGVSTETLINLWLQEKVS